MQTDCSLVRAEFRTASDECAGPGNEARLID